MALTGETRLRGKSGEPGQATSGLEARPHIWGESVFGLVDPH